MPSTNKPVGPDLDPNCLTMIVSRKEFFESISLKKNHEKIPAKGLLKTPKICSEFLMFVHVLGFKCWYSAIC